MLEAEDAETMLAYLERYKYASLRHVTASLLWHTMVRMGAARGLDVRDYDPENQSLRLRHRPDTGTPLKNKERGERMLAISGDFCLVLDDWLRERRPDVTDEHGCRPLLATSYGRVASGTIRKFCYQLTRPCITGRSVRITATQMNVLRPTMRKRISARQASARTRSGAEQSRTISIVTSPRQPSVTGRT